MKKLFVILVLWASTAYAQEITVTGYGANIAEAKKDAFTKAIEGAIGVLISSELKIKNGVLIEESITSKSQGFIERYDTLSTVKNGELYELTIKALVSQAKLTRELEIITGTKIELDGKSVAAGVQTKKSLYDQLVAELPKFFEEIEQELLKSYKVEIVELKFDHEKSGSSTPFSLTLKLYIDYDIYNNVMEKLHNMFAMLGADFRIYQPAEYGDTDVKKRTGRNALFILRKISPNNPNPFKMMAKLCQGEMSYTLYNQSFACLYNFSDSTFKHVKNFLSTLRKNNYDNIRVNFITGNGVLNYQFKVPVYSDSMLFPNKFYAFISDYKDVVPQLSPAFYVYGGANSIRSFDFSLREDGILKTFSNKIKTEDIETITSIYAEVIY